MSMAAAEAALTEQVRKPPDRWKLGDGAMLLAYTCVTLWTIRYHEKWADEAQAWLIARDLDLRTIWFHESRYEGSPGLWHTILWVAQHVFRARYGAVGYLGLAFAVAGAAVLLFKAPFPRIVRWPLAFTYVMVYQYAVIARPYTLLPLLAFCAAIFFKDLRRPERITIVLTLMALLTLHGTILAACLGLAYLADVTRAWKSLDQSARKKFVICAAAMACTFVFIILILRPTPDVEEFATKGEMVRLSESLHVKQPTWDMKLVSVVTGAFLDYVVPSLAFILLAGAWCAIRRKWLPFAASVTALVAFYMVIHGYAHHHGTVTIAAITALWLAWPTDRSGLSMFENRALTGMIGLLLVFCGVQVWDSIGAIANEYRYPYSGAEDAANYLKSEHAEQKTIFGFVYGIAGIQAYFDHNIFANMHTAYYHHGVPLEGRNLDLGEVEHVAPGYIVVFTEQPKLMLDSGVLDGLIPLGYQLAHLSDGYLLYRRGVYVRQTYLIFSRKDAGPIRLHPRAPSENANGDTENIRKR